MHDLLLFDLDGTLCDPLDGLSLCINYALEGYGFEPIERLLVASFVGPPLNVAFESIVGDDSAELIDGLVEKYRERYSEIGYSECRLYPGVANALHELAATGVTLGICTSKRADFAVRILEMFELSTLFDFIDGGGIRIPKARQIERLLREGLLTSRSIMVGDRAVDLAAAHTNGLASAGVLWGYGSRSELVAEAPRYLFESPREWRTLLGDGFRGVRSGPAARI